MTDKPNRTKQVRKKWLKAHPTLTLTKSVTTSGKGKNRVYHINYRKKKR